MRPGVAPMRWLAATLLGSALVAVVPLTAAAGGDTTTVDDRGISARATVTPSIAKIGERVTFRARVIGYGRVHWLPPEPDSNSTWGSGREGFTLGRPPQRRFGKDAGAPPAWPGGMIPDTSWVELPLQVFTPGIVPIPGLRFRMKGLAYASGGDGGEGPIMRVPVVNLIVVDVITAADSAKGLRDVHGPLPAPWWERVPWRWVLGGLGLVALVIVMVRALRRRRPVPVVAAGPLRRDPMAEALAELRALRALHLPEHGRFAEHAFRLGQILRRYLEATIPLAKPGDTTPELVAHLRGGGLAPDDLQRLTALLRLWDRVKFAREPFTAEEALRTEGAVEAYIRARGTAVVGEPGRVA